MRSLYLRAVPDDVIERLEKMAAMRRTSVSSVAIQELTEASRRADNPALLGSLPDANVDMASIVADLRTDREGR